MLACDKSTPEDCSARVREFSILFNTQNHSATASIIPIIRRPNYSSPCQRVSREYKATDIQGDQKQYPFKNNNGLSSWDKTLTSKSYSLIETLLIGAGTHVTTDCFPNFPLGFGFRPSS